MPTSCSARIRVRDELPGGDAAPQDRSLHVELQHNLIITHAVCVGEPFAADVVRAMLCIRINTLMRGHSGIRVETLQALAAMLNAGVVPVVPQLGSVGASGDLAPLSHLAIVLLGGGEAFYRRRAHAGCRSAASARASRRCRCRYKEGLALNNGTAQMLATGVLALDALERTAGHRRPRRGDDDRCVRRSHAAHSRAEVHALRPHPGQVQTAAHLRELLAGSTLADIPYHLVPRFRHVAADGWDDAGRCRQLRFDIGWDWVPLEPAPWPRERSTSASCRSAAARSTSRRIAIAALHAAGAWRGARCVDAGQSRARHRAELGHRQSAGLSGRRGRAAHRGAGDFRRPFPRHAAGAGDELRQGRDPGAGLDLRAPPQQAGRPGDQRRPAGVPDRQRGRHRIGLHDRAVHRRGASSTTWPRARIRRRCIRSRPAPMPRTTSRWAPTRRATCWR